MIRRFSPPVFFLLLLINNFGTGITNEGTGKSSLQNNGCFSKSNLDDGLDHPSSKLTWFKNDIENIEDCARTCQGFGLIGIQRQVCLCLQLSDDDKTQLLRISDRDSCCDNDKTNDATHFAGFGTFSLYSNDCEINAHNAIVNWISIALYILAEVVKIVVVILLIVTCCPKNYDPVLTKPREPRD